MCFILKPRIQKNLLQDAVGDTYGAFGDTVLCFRGVRFRVKVWKLCLGAA